MKDKTRLALALLFVFVFFISAYYPLWYTNQLWIGYETYKAATSGVFTVSTGYSIYAICPVINALSSIGLIVVYSGKRNG